MIKTILKKIARYKRQSIDQCIRILFGIFTANKLLTKRTLLKNHENDDLFLLIFLSVEKEFARRDSKL